MDSGLMSILLLQMWTNAHLILMTVMTRQTAPTLRAHFHALVTLVGPEMGLLVKVCQIN